MDEQSDQSLAAAGATVPGAERSRAFLLLVIVASGLVAVEALVLPELFSAPAYSALRPYLEIFGALSLAAVVVAAAAASGRLRQLGIAGGLLVASLPASALTVAFLSTGTPVGAWGWGVLGVGSMGLGVALHTGHVPRWRPVPVAVGFVLASTGATMLVLPGSFARVTYGDLVDALLPFGALMVVAGAGVVAGESFGRRRIMLAAAAIAVIGLGVLVNTFVAQGLWVGITLFWMLALFLLVALRGEITLHRMAIAQLALLVGLGAWMLASHLRGPPAIGLDVLPFHAAVLLLAGAWLLGEVRPHAVWPARVLAGLALALAAAAALEYWSTPGGAGGIASNVLTPIDTALALVALAVVLLARTWWPGSGITQVAQTTAISAAGAVALVDLLVMTATAGASPPEPILGVDPDQAFLLLGAVAALGLLAWSRGNAGPIQPRLYSAAMSVLAIGAVAAVITQRALEALALSNNGTFETRLLALTDRVLILLLVLLVLTLVGSIALISTQIMGPIRHLIDVSSRRAAGDLTARANLTPADELGRLGAALDLAFAARVVAEERTDAERARLRTFVGGSLDAFIAVDATGRIVRWNTRAETMFGWREAEVLGRRVAELVVPQMLQEQHRAGMARFLETGVGRPAGQRIRVAALHRDGHTFPVEMALSAPVDRAEGVGAFIRDVTEIERQEEALAHLARYDLLTDLPNRVLVAERWQLAEAAATLDGTRVCLALLDVDHFRSVNNALGHPAGDELLREVGRRLFAGARAADTVGHLGGDEFLVVLTGLRSEADATAAAGRLRAALERPVEIDGRELAVAASVGLAVSDARGERFDEAFRKADVAAHAVKLRGGDGVAAYAASMESATAERITLGADLRAAIDANGLYLAYQPVIDADSGEILAVEALTRWDHPTRGAILPAEFVAVAEESGLIGSLGLWILGHALDDLGHWQAAGLVLGVHINASVRQFGDSSFVDTVLREVATRALPRGALTVELTESVLIRDLPRLRDDLVKLRAAGVRVSLDDFGTGYSAIGYLQHLPIDEIKLDRSIVTGSVNDLYRQPILRAMRDIARGLGLVCVAEGVEDERTWDMLAAFGGFRLQGFGIGRPMPVEALAGWCATHGRRVAGRIADRLAVPPAQSLGASEPPWIGSPSSRAQVARRVSN